MYLPKIGSTCLFSLTPKFETLNGVYSVTALATFNNLAVKVNFVDDLYTPAGLTQQDYIQDFSSYQNTTVAVVSPVSDATTTYYFPEPIIAKVPDPTVQKYSRIYLDILIGPFKDTAVLQSLATQIGQMVTNTTGVTNPVRVLANPKNDVWLTESQYQALETQRQANIKQADSLYTQLQNALALNTTYQSKIAALEEIILQMSQPSQPAGSKKSDVQDT